VVPSDPLVVENEIYPEFIEKIHKAIAEIKVAHALDSTAYFGPVATREQFESVSSYINMARKESEIISEGTYNHDGNNGYYINPMVVTGVKENHVLVQEEIFGPLSVVLKADGFDEAIDLCNKTIYGLSASVFTNDLSKAHRFLEEAHVGMVRVNQETAGVEYQAPFGGMKLSSSHTREQGQSALDFYTQIKTCSIKHTF
jgi:aldehyde dehydrogenase (NAD+)